MPFTFTSMSATWVCRESSANTEVRASTYQEPRLVFRMAAVPGERAPTMNTFGEHGHMKPPYAQTIRGPNNYLSDKHIHRSYPSTWAAAASGFLPCSRRFPHSLENLTVLCHLFDPLPGPTHLWWQ